MTNLSASPVNSVGATLARLPSLPRDKVVELWHEHMGKPPPRAASSALLMRAVAYSIQEQQLGGLRGPELRILRNIAQRAGGSGKTRQSAKNARAIDGQVSVETPDTLRRERRAQPRSRSSRPAIPIVLKPGTRLVREWQGKSHTIDVRCDGFGWNGEVYRSLSAVARAITGTHCSGNRFFRL